MLEQFMNNCSLCEGPTLEKFVGDCLLWEGIHSKEEKEREEEGAAETVYDELTVTPHSPFPCATGGEEVEKNQDWNWAQEEGIGGGRMF